MAWGRASEGGRKRAWPPTELSARHHSCATRGLQQPDQASKRRRKDPWICPTVSTLADPAAVVDALQPPVVSYDPDYIAKISTAPSSPLGPLDISQEAEAYFPRPRSEQLLTDAPAAAAAVDGAAQEQTRVHHWPSRLSKLAETASAPAKGKSNAAVAGAKPGKAKSASKRVDTGTSAGEGLCCTCCQQLLTAKSRVYHIIDDFTFVQSMCLNLCALCLQAQPTRKTTNSPEKPQPKGNLTKKLPQTLYSRLFTLQLEHACVGVGCSCLPCRVQNAWQGPGMFLMQVVY